MKASFAFALATISCLCWGAQPFPIPDKGGPIPPADRLVETLAGLVETFAERYDQRKTRTVDLGMDILGQTLPTKEALLFAIPLSSARPKTLDPGPYREALNKALEHPDSRIRALGCWVAAHTFDLGLLRSLGWLLDDESESFLFNSGMSQAPLPYATEPSAMQMPVRKWAALAIRTMTGVSFQNRADFDTWYADFPNRKQRLWFWAAVWDASWPYELLRQFPMRTELKRFRQRPDGCAVGAEFETLPEGEAVRILRNASSREAVLAELQGHFSGGDHRSRLNYGLGMDPTYPKPKQIAAWLKSKRLDGKIVTDLSASVASLPSGGLDPWWNLLPYLVDKATAKTLLDRIYEFGNEPSLLEAVTWERIRLDPKREKELLIHLIENHPTGSTPIQMLVERFGSQAASTIARSFAQSPSWDRSMIVRGLQRAVRKGVPMDGDLVLQLLKSEPPPKPSSSDDTMVELALLTNLVLGRRVASYGEIAVARPYEGKGTRRDPLRVSIAQERLRTACIAALENQS